MEQQGEKSLEISGGGKLVNHMEDIWQFIEI